MIKSLALIDQLAGRRAIIAGYDPKVFWKTPDRDKEVKIVITALVAGPSCCFVIARPPALGEPRRTNAGHTHTTFREISFACALFVAGLAKR